MRCCLLFSGFLQCCVTIWNICVSHGSVVTQILGEVENQCIFHDFSLLAIYLPKIIKIGGNLTKF